MIIRIAMAAVLWAAAQVQVADGTGVEGARGNAAKEPIPYVIADLETWHGVKQWNHGVELRYTAWGGKAYFALRTFDMTPAEESLYLWPDATGIEQINEVASAALTINSEPLAFEPFGELHVASLPIGLFAGASAHIDAFDAAGTHVFSRGADFH